MANITLDPATVVNCALTGGNLIMTSTGGASCGVRGASALIGVKVYWETTHNVNGCSGIGTVAAGVGTPPTSGFSNFYQMGASSFPGNAIYRQASSLTPSLGTIGAGSVICHALDLSFSAANPMGAYWARLGAAGNWNGSASANPATGAGGIALWGAGIPVYPFAWGTSTGDKVTCNFGDTAFTGSAPAGFTTGFTAASPAVNVVDTQTAIEEWASASVVQAQLTQAAIEEWASAAGVQLQLTQLGTETWATGGASSAIQMWLTQMGAEVWATPTGPGTQMVLTQIGAEVWASVPVVAPPASSQARVMIMA